MISSKLVQIRDSQVNLDEDICIYNLVSELSRIKSIQLKGGKSRFLNLEKCIWTGEYNLYCLK